MCAARLVAIDIELIKGLGPCPSCGARKWARVSELRTTAHGRSTVRAVLTVHSDGSQDAAVFPEPVSLELKIPSPAPQPQLPVQSAPFTLPTEEELASLGIRGDFVVAGVILHPPRMGDPADSWILELMIDGQWNPVFRVGVQPEDALLDALDRLDRYVREWRTER